LARAFLELHRAYRQGQERLASLDEALGREDSAISPSPWEEVRDFFHYCDNYIDSIDRVAEGFAAHTGIQGPNPLGAARDWLANTHNVHLKADNGAPLRHYDPASRTLTLSAQATPSSQLFQIAHQASLLEHDDLLEATLDFANFQTPESPCHLQNWPRQLFCRGRYPALCPFLASGPRTPPRSRGARRPVQRQHRTSGPPSFDHATSRAQGYGTITKRHSATRLQFARFGGACPLWNVHRAFETPGQFLRQLAETPDGLQYLCLARDVSKPGGAYRAPTRRYAIGLGCEIRHASALVYADDLDITNRQAFEPIGISCRICERHNCHQRSVPPLERHLKVDPNSRGILPYGIGD